MWVSGLVQPQVFQDLAVRRLGDHLRLLYASDHFHLAAALLAFLNIYGEVNRASYLVNTVIGAALEHHSSLVYGDFRKELRAVAAILDIPVLEIT